MIKIQSITFFILLFFALSSAASVASGEIEVLSPNGKLKAKISAAGKLSYMVLHEADTVIAPSAAYMTLKGGEIFGQKTKVLSAKVNKVDQTIQSPFYKKSQITDAYNELEVRFQGDYGVRFRVYDDGVAYRFFSFRKKDFQVENEEVNFNFNQDYQAIVPYVNKKQEVSLEEQFWSSFENTYTHAKLSSLSPNRLAFLPLVVKVKNGKTVCITEADLESYPGLYLINKNGSTSLKGMFAPFPKTEEQGGHNNLQAIVKEREPFIAKCKGTRSFPWRVMVVAADDKELANNDMVYKLAAPSRVKDISWIKPGKVAWDWWNDWNIRGVDFKSGVNNDTYKYYIDFASKKGIEYVILDEGWAVNKKADLMQVVPEIDIKQLVQYGKERNVGIILWAGYKAFDKDMEAVSRHYAQMGVKGFKVDFMDRDDQKAVDFYYRTAEIGAKYHLLIDFHGAYKPTGMQRTYPNVLNFEGVHGLEQMKWSAPSVDQVTYDVTIPFIRMLAGPMDYTQGAMKNATKESYTPVFSDPMSQGTRCRQLAQYVVFEAPLNMLCDNPSNYLKEEECSDFMASVPEVWDRTIALNGKIAEHIAIARKKGKEWYIGGLTNWEGRDMDLDLSFLGSGKYRVELFKDGVNADRSPSDYKREVFELDGGRKLKVSMAPGGGFAARIFPL